MAAIGMSFNTSPDVDIYSAYSPLSSGGHFFDYGTQFGLYGAVNTGMRWKEGIPPFEWILVGLVYDKTAWLTARVFIGSNHTGTVDLVTEWTPNVTPTNYGVVIGSPCSGPPCGRWSADYNEIRVANIPRSQAWFTSYWKAVMRQGLE